MADRALKCRVGIHQWTEWNDTNVGLIPAGDREALNIVNNFAADGVDVNSLELTTRYRECKRCGHIQVRQFVNW